MGLSEATSPAQRRQLEEADPRRVQAVFELAGELGLEDARPLATAAAFGLRARFHAPRPRRGARPVVMG